jgi:hypothetical protein
MAEVTAADVARLIDDAADRTGPEPALIERLWTALGFSVVVEAAGPHLTCAKIGAVSMKGFCEPTELCVAGQAT